MSDRPQRDAGQQGVALADRLRAALADATRRRDGAARSALRAVLGAIDNSGAVVVADDATGDEPGAGPSPAGAPRIARSTAGVGSTERARRLVSEDDVRALLAADVAERREALASAESAGRHDHVARLAAELAALEPFLS